MPEPQQPAAAPTVTEEFDVNGAYEPAAPTPAPDPVPATEPVPAPAAKPAAAAPTAPKGETKILPIEPVKPIAEEEVEDEPVEETLVQTVMSRLGYDFGDEEFEDSEEGLVAMTAKASELRAEEMLNEVFSKFPSVKEHLDFVRMGGDPDRFLGTRAEQDWSQAATDTVEAQKAVIRAYFKVRGDEETFVNDTIELYEDKKVLADRAAAAKNALVQHQTQKRQAVMETQRRQHEAQQRENEKIWAQVRETVTKAPDIKGLQLSEKDRSKFLDYISKPVTRSGETQRDLDAAKLGLEDQLALDLLMFRKLDLKGIVDTKAKSVAAKSLRDKLMKGQAPTGAGKRRVATGGGDDDFLSLGELNLE